MTTFDRRAFVKRTALLTAAAGQIFRLPAASARPPGELSSALDGKPGGEPFVAAPQAVRRGAQHPFFTAVKNRPKVIAHRGVPDSGRAKPCMPTSGL